jgi:hypothetical protein
MTAPLTPESLDTAEWVCDNPSKVLTMEGTRELSRHLSLVEAAAIARYADGLVEVVAWNMPEVLNDPEVWSTHDDVGYKALARRLLAIPEAQEVDRG